MTNHHTSEAQVDELIAQAVKKLSASRENDICRYLPMPAGGYIHHFTMRKMRTEDPAKLQEMIKKFILHADKPVSVAPKPRAARGSRKRRDQLQFTKVDIEKMLTMARAANDKEMVRKLTPRKDLRTIKRELIVSIRHGQVDQDLWQAYAEAITQHSHAATASIA